MKKIKKMVVNILCEVGKNGVGKSTFMGMYDIKVPDELKNMKKSNGINEVKSGNYSYLQSYMTDVVVNLGY